MFDNDNPNPIDYGIAQRNPSTQYGGTQAMSFGNTKKQVTQGKVLTSQSPSNQSYDSKFEQFYQQQSEHQYQGHSKSSAINVLQSDYETESEQENRPLQYKKGSQEFYVWGSNQFGQLGMQSNEKILKSPKSFKLDQLQIKQISCGLNHTVFLTEKGLILSMGSNLKGQLGVGDESLNQSFQPVIVEPLQMWEAKKVVCSKNSTFALMESGELFSWGSHKYGVLGIGECSEYQQFPVKIILEDQQDKYIHIIEITAGKNHVALLAKNMSDSSRSNKNLYYTWGQNRFGQLGAGDQEDRNQPSQVELEFNPMNIACGNDFSVIQDFSNRFYTTGNNSKGQLGALSEVQFQTTFQKIVNKNMGVVTKIECKEFISCIDSQGDIFLWGPTPIGQFATPMKFQELLQNKIQFKDFSVADNFLVLINESGKVYQLGSTLCSGSQSDEVLFQLYENMFFKMCACGSDFVIGENFQPEIYQKESQPNFAKSFHYETQIATSTLKKDGEQKKKRTPSLNDNRHSQSQSFALNGISQFYTQEYQQAQITPRQFQLPDSIASNKSLFQNNAIIQSYRDQSNYQENTTPGKSQTPTSRNRPRMTPAQSTPNLQLRIPQNRNEDIFQSKAKNITTPQVVSPYNGASHQKHQQMSAILSTTPPQISPNNRTSNMNLLAASQSHSINHSLLQSIDQSPYTKQTTQLNRHNTSQQNLQQFTRESLIKEKQELQQQINVEVQRRLLVEKDLNEVLKQLDQIKNGESGLYETQQMNEQLRVENEELYEQKQLLFNENQKLQDQFNQLHEIQQQIQSESHQKLTSSTLENENLKLKLSELEKRLKNQMSRSFDLTRQNTNDDQLQRKNKEIYDLTVQLGSLKEQNFQQKKDLDDMKREFEQRLKEQQERSEREFNSLQEEYDLIRESLNQYKELAKEVQQMKVLAEQKNNQIGCIQNELEIKLIDIEDKNSIIFSQEREIHQMKVRHDSLLEEIQGLKDQVSQQQTQIAQLQAPKMPPQQLQQKEKKEIVRSKKPSVASNENRKERYTSKEDDIPMHELKKAAKELLKTDTLKPTKSQSRISHPPITNEKSNKGNTFETPKQLENKQQFQSQDQLECRKLCRMNRKHNCSQQAQNQENNLTNDKSQKSLKRKSMNPVNNYKNKIMKEIQTIRKNRTPVKNQDVLQEIKNDLEQPRHSVMVQESYRSPLVKQSKKSPSPKPKARPQIQEEEDIVTHVEIEKPNEIENEAPLSMFDHIQATPDEKLILSQRETKQPEQSQIAFSTLQSDNSLQENLRDMKTKLTDIQCNKQFLEKKIFEYEKKLKELKGGNSKDQNHSRSQSKLSSLHNVKAVQNID